MGGMGSTRWGAHVPKTIVENCLTLDIKAMIRAGFDIGLLGASGDVLWERAGQAISSVEFTLLPGLLSLHYRIEGVARKSRIPLTHTLTPPGGRRWWFLCPFCRRRVRKLYIPPHEVAWACRHCHNLTYWSAQHAHEDDRGDALKVGFALMWRLDEIAEAMFHATGKRRERLRRKYQKLFSRLGTRKEAEVRRLLGLPPCQDS